MSDVRPPAFAFRQMVGYLLLALAASSCTPHPSDEEKHTVSELTTHMSTQGLGRYLIDLPSSWRYGSGDVTLYYGLGTDFETVQVAVIDQDVTPAQFQAAVDWRAQRLKAVINHKAQAPMLVGVWALDARVDGDSDRLAVLFRYYEGTTLDNYHTHEIHLLLGNTYVLLKADSYKGVIAPVEDRLKTLAKQIFVVRDPARVGPGFILGPVVIRGTQDHEAASVKFYDPQRRDLTLEINSSAVTPDEERRLLQRGRTAVSAFQERGADLHWLREGKRAFAGMQGEEAIVGSDAKLKNGTRVRGLMFSAETYRPDPGLLRPTLMVQLTAGGHLSWRSDAEKQLRRDAPDYLMTEGYLPRFAAKPPKPSAVSKPEVTASLTDYEATALWDAILPTIRPRPGAVPPPQPKNEWASPISREQAEANRRALDDFLASRPEGKPGTEGGK